MRCEDFNILCWGDRHWDHTKTNKETPTVVSVWGYKSLNKTSHCGKERKWINSVDMGQVEWTGLKAWSEKRGRTLDDSRLPARGLSGWYYESAIEEKITNSISYSWVWGSCRMQQMTEQGLWGFGARDSNAQFHPKPITAVYNNKRVKC